ncbi:MAG TPA: hypothetical protein VM238_10070 [Phycisphaerae bacterium]|nr:hypothetical protein [Phycisphaerae bacterium]
MDLRIENVLRKSEWVARVSAVLHDALIERRDVSDVRSREFRLNVDRVCYERAERGRLLWSIPIWRYPSVSASLSIAPVERVEDARRQAKDIGEPELLLSLDIDARSNSLRLESSFGLIHVQLGLDACLSVSDTGTAAGGVAMRELIGRVIDPDLVAEVCAARVV